MEAIEQMGLKENLENRIRGWLPKEPSLPRNKVSNSPDAQRSQSSSKPSYLRPIRISLGLLLALIGILYLFTKQYELAGLYFACAVGIVIVAYFGWIVRARTAVGVLLVGFGVAGFFYNDMAIMLFGFAAIFAPFFLTIVKLFAFWILIGLAIGAVFLVRANRKNGAVAKFLRKNLSRRRLLPYGIAAIFIFLTYLAAVSGVELAYAIPIAFIISGVLVLKGLRRFAVTIPAVTVLLISMLVFGAAAAGTYAVTYVPENRFLTTADAPNVDTLNLAVKSVAGGIRLYFTDDDSQLCHIAFVKEYGPVFSSRSAEYHSPTSYDEEPATVFNYTIGNGEANITASSYTVLVNITVNQNLKLNFNLYTYFGDITVEAPPAVNSIQTMNLTSQLGAVKLKITNTANLQNLIATSPYIVEADISSDNQNQNATIQLKGGSVKINLYLTDIESEIYAYSTSTYGELAAKTQGFVVLNQNNTYFHAQTPDYSPTVLKRIDITATSNQSTRPSVDITANYAKK
jgi:hypothetical protein